MSNLESMPQEDIRNSSLDELYNASYVYGKSVASANLSDMPVVGEEFESIDGEMTIENANEAHEEFVRAVSMSESENTRQYSPAEFWISALNEREDSEKAWEAVEEGIYNGIKSVADAHIQQWKTEEEDLLSKNRPS